VSLHRPEVAALRDGGVTLTTGTNLFFAEHEGGDVIAVTGTKGKSTTSALLAHLLRAAGEDVRLAGNVGRPLLDVLGEGAPHTVWVLELSSFQIADLEFAPRLGVVLNLFDEHLDWHGDSEIYHADKLRLLTIPPPCLAVLCGADPRLAVVGETLPLAPRWFGTASTLHVQGGAVWDGGERLYDGAGLPLVGAHNLLNLCAALTVLCERGHAISGREEAIAAFQPLPHRLQTVAEHRGVRFVNDSIATTPESAAAALQAFAGSAVALIAGGHDRGQRYEALAEAIAAHGAVRAVAAMPATGERLLAAIRARGGGPALTAAPDLAAALDLAVAGLAGGGVVLLSPAAPSFGAYRDFEERGRHFEELVHARIDDCGHGPAAADS
jgi:UDP-N-acetylmuramoylalanine--D-glutamate ligase